MSLKSRSELYKLLPDVATAVCAEIGVAEGYNSADMLRWGIKHLYMVDNWNHIKEQTGDGHNPKIWHDKNYIDAMARVEQWKDKVIVLQGISWEMAAHVPDNSLDLVYIDACHMYDCVLNDLKAWYPKVKQGGIIAGHDVANGAYGVNQAVNEFTHGKWILIPENGPDASFYFIKQ